MSELHAQGLAGPTLRDVLPGAVLLALAVTVPVAFLTWLSLRLGVLGLVLGLVLLGAGAVPLVRWRRAAARRRGGVYLPAELAGLDGHALAVAVGRMLRRDGWHVISAPFEGRPRLSATDRSGRQLDVVFRSDPKGPGATPLRDVGRLGVDRVLRVVVTTGSYGRADVLWAARQGGVYLVDGAVLADWAAGTTAAAALGLSPSGLPGVSP